jgi:hypothetical protein
VSYDLLVFAPAAAPGDRIAFIAWFSQVVRLRDGHLLPDPSQTSPALRGWYHGMNEAFPHVGTAAAGRAEMLEDEINADYRFSPDAVFARFEWRVSRKAYHLGMKLARAYGLGFFDASGENAMCYTWVNGRFILAHRGESLAV